MSETDAQLNPNGIAVIGMSGRFPGAGNVAEFWENLRNGVESLTFFSEYDLESEGLDAGLLQHPNYVNAGMELEGVEYFDAGFFGYSPRDAEILDPQQRLFLEDAWAALEDAGYDPKRYKGLVGVYAGTGLSHYLLGLYANREIMESVGGFQLILANDKDHLTTRVAYKLNLKGPAVTVQTTCSTSLVAVCQACQSLLTYQCDIALAGGSSVILPRRTGYFYQPGGIASPDGHCRAFAAQAQGTIGGSGVGVVVLKRLQEALADGDHIYAVVRGFGLNNDGSDKVGYTAPSVQGQAEVITMSLGMAGLSADSIAYVEAHGTATPMGDPIEVAALTAAFRATTTAKSFCALGSVKSNIGHLDPAAGVAGFIKTVLALHHKAIPPTLHFERPNPNIDFANSPFYVADKLREWNSGAMPRRAGVSSFGIGGTNAHVTLEEAPPRQSDEPARAQHLLTLSAQTPPALIDATANLAEHLAQNPDLALADVAYTLQVGRRAFEHRRAVLCADAKQAMARLRTGDDGDVWSGSHSETAPPVVFMFSGQGAQHVGMARELYRTERVFREHLDLCAEVLRPHLNVVLQDLLYAERSGLETADRLIQTQFGQPALFAVEYALARLWMSWGVHPQAMVGHSLGEYVAACLAGVLSLENSLALVAFRGQLMQEMQPGRMLAVMAWEHEVLPLPNDLSLAAVNGPQLCVVSGPPDSIARYENELMARNVGCRRLHTSHAFHSSMMQPMMERFGTELRRFSFRAPQIPYLSNTSGTWITTEEATAPEYWVRHVRQTVRFLDNLRELSRTSGNVLLEVGPGQTLTTLARQFDGWSTEQVLLSSLPNAKDAESELATYLSTLARLWVAGVEVDWDGFYAGERRLRVPLPTYPFQRQRYWIDPPRQNPRATNRASGARHRAQNVEQWLYKPIWQLTRRAVQPRVISSSKPLRWLVLGGQDGLATALAARLSREGRDLVFVRPGNRFSRVEPNRYVLDPGRSEDYANLIRELATLQRLPDRVLHLWMVEEDPNAASSSASASSSEREALLQRGFYSLLFLARALGEHAPGRAIELTLISSGMHSVLGTEVVCPEKAAARGACAVIAQEFPQITCRCVDLELSLRQGEENQPVVDELIPELYSAATDAVVAFRKRERWTLGYERLRARSSTHEARVRRHGVYLITGGLGGVGLALSEYLARHFQAKLILTSRSYASDDPDVRVPGARPEDQRRVEEARKRVRELERAGAEVVVVSADATSRDNMDRVARLIDERFGTLHGFIHAAGIAGGGLISLKTRDMAARVLAPKVAGLRVLEEVFDQVELDFVVLCSSLASLLGGIGQADYCAANCVLDSFAQDQRRRARWRTVSINWDRWLEAGMAVDASQGRDEQRPQGLLNAEAVRAFELILASDEAQVAVSTTELSRRVAEWGNQKLSTEPDVGQHTRVAARHARPSLKTEYVEPRSDAERRIAQVWQQLLGIQEVGVDDNFLELGGHSLLAIQLLSRLRGIFGVDLSVQAFFDNPTIAAVAAMVSNGGSQRHADTERIEELLHQVEVLTDEELRGLGTDGTEARISPTGA